MASTTYEPTDHANVSKAVACSFASISLFFWNGSNFVGFNVCNYRYDPKTQEIENIVFPAGLSKEKRKVARMVLAADRTPYKEALKFHSIMCFATHYCNCIETTEQKEKRISHKHRKILRRSGGATPLITTYRIDSRPVPADGTKRHYTKPTEQVSVKHQR